MKTELAQPRNQQGNYTTTMNTNDNYLQDYLLGNIDDKQASAIAKVLNRPSESNWGITDDELMAMMVLDDELDDETIPEEPILAPVKPVTARLPKSDTVAAVKVNNNAVDVSKVTTEKLLDAIIEINNLAALGNYLDADKKILRSASIVLTERGIPPINRECRKFKPIECNKNESASDFMIDLQTFDLYWVWYRHRGHTTPWFEKNPPLESHHNGTTHNKEWASVFSGEKFDWKLAKEIAVGSFMYSDDEFKPSGRHHKKPSNSGKFINITKSEKIKRLSLPEFIHNELSILRSEASRLKSYQLKKESLKEKDRIRDIKTKSMDVRKQLEINADKSTSRISEAGVETLANVWVSLAIAKGSLTLAKIEYETLTGTIIDRHFIRNKKVALGRLVRFA